MKNVYFIAVSDVHWHEWANQFNSVDRLKIVKALSHKIYNLAYEQSAAILLPGDLVHNPEHISNRTLQELVEFYNDVKVSTFAIDGNHDQSEINSLTNRSPNYVSTLSKVIPKLYNVADQSEYTTSCLIQGISYLTGNRGFKHQLNRLKKEHREHPDRKKVLLIHSDLPRVKDSSGYQIDKVHDIPANISKLFKKWDLVLSGHIHMPQRPAKNIIMVGAPYQQRRSDRKLVPGYWEIYDDLTFKFKKLKLAPVYLDGKTKDEWNFFTKKPKKPSRTTSTNDKGFTKGTQTDDLVDNYMDAIKDSDKNKKKLLKTVLR